MLSCGKADRRPGNIGQVPTAEHRGCYLLRSGFIQHKMPNVGLFNVLIPLGEFLVGVGLLLGTLTTLATLMAMVMNFSFLFSGTVSTNAIYLLVEIFLIVAGANAGRIGFDRWVLPFLRGLFGKNKDTYQTDPNRKIA